MQFVPILWRTLLGQFVRVFLLSMSTFVALLMVSRLHETASFASLGAPLKTLFFFILYQFPYILPVAIPISCLIASLLLMQQLSRSYELVALRSLGLGLKTITAPIFTLAFLLSCVNFYIVSEVATDAHLASKQMVQEIATLNPLTLLKGSTSLQRKDAYIQTGYSRAANLSKDVLIATRQENNNRITLFFAKELSLEDAFLLGKDVTFISSIPTQNNPYDHLIVENQKETKTAAHEFTGLIRKTSWRVCPDHLQMPLLLAKIRKESTLLEQAKKEPLLKVLQKDLSISKERCTSEIARRLQLGITPLTFTLMGVAFGMEIGRRGSKKGILAVTLLAAFSFALFFLAKGLERNATLSILFFALPQMTILFFSLRTLKRISRGIE